MSSLESWLSLYLLNSLWQIPLLSAFGLLAARIVSRVGDAAEHRVWVSVLLLQSLLPAVSALPLAWLRTLFAFGSARGSGEAHVSVVLGSGVSLSALHLPARSFSGIAMAYGMVTVYFAATLLWRWRKLSATRQETVELTLSGEAAEDWAQYQRRFGVDGAALANSSRVVSPVTIGLSRKLLLLPTGMAASLPRADMRAVIAHEFAHMRRNDFTKNLLYEVMSLPAAYHPALWLTRERLMETREAVCDLLAAQIAGRSDYARSLLRLASRLATGVPVRTPHAIGIFDANSFERRLMKLTVKKEEVTRTRRLTILAACAVLGIGASASALALRVRVDSAAAMNAAKGENRASPTAGTIIVPSSVMAENKLVSNPPKYPVAAKKAQIQGAVVLDAVIGKGGNIEKLTVISGPKELQQSSLDAVRQWTYKPYLVNEEPAEIETTINVIYSLEK